MPPSAMTVTFIAGERLGAVGDGGDLRDADAGHDARRADRPGPMPTLTASAPALASASAASPVATLPAMICALGKLRRTSATAWTTAREWPCAVSMQMTSQPALRSASTRSSRSAPTPTRRADAQPAEVVLGGVRVLLRLLDVLDGDQALEEPAAVDDQQLLDPVLVQQLLGGLDAWSPRRW